jgi:hypothetical protein
MKVERSASPLVPLSETNWMPSERREGLQLGGKHVVQRRESVEMTGEQQAARYVAQQREARPSEARDPGHAAPQREVPPYGEPELRHAEPGLRHPPPPSAPPPRRSRVQWR